MRFLLHGFTLTHSFPSTLCQFLLITCAVLSPRGFVSPLAPFESRVVHVWIRDNETETTSGHSVTTRFLGISGVYVDA